MISRFPLVRLGSVLSVAGALAVPVDAAAQQLPADSTRIADMRTPSSPAFVLLDETPSAVERPNTPRGLAAAVNAATRGGSVVPDNFALEFSPYWLVPHPTVMFDNHFRSDVLQTALRSLSISVATEQEVTGGPLLPDTTRRLALGARTLLADGDPSGELDSLRAALGTLQTRFLDVDDRKDSLIDELETALTQADSARLRTALAQFSTDSADVMAELRTTALAIQDADRDRYGLVVELAAAAAVEFPGESFSRGRVTRGGFWATLSYRIPATDFDLVSVARFLWNDNRAGEHNSLDVGGRLVWRPERFLLSTELVSRLEFEDVPANGVNVDGTYRWSLNLDFFLTKDVTLSAAFGRNFLGTTGDARNLIALVGVALGLGQIPIGDFISGAL